MSTGIVTMADEPRIAMRIAMTTKVYGRLRASRTIHIKLAFASTADPASEVYQTAFKHDPARDIVIEEKMATNAGMARRRARLARGFVPQVAAAVPQSEEHAIAEIRWFPVREPVSGNRYTVLRVKTRSGLTGWGECAQAAEQDARALEKEWSGRSATLYAAIDRSMPLAGALDMAMLDILGKACRAPVYRVLGGPTRNKIRALTDSTAAPGFHAVAVAAAPPPSRHPGQAYFNQVQALLERVGGERGLL